VRKGNAREEGEVKEAKEVEDVEEKPEASFLYRLENIFSSVFMELHRFLIIWCAD